VYDYSAYISNINVMKEDLLKALEFVDWKQKVRKDSTVFIKPNFTFPYYMPGITTTPELLKNLLEILKDRADKVIVGESDGGNNSFTADNAFKGHNMHEVCRETGADLINLSKLPSVSIEEKIQGKNVKVILPKMLLDEVNCFISVPVLKVHVMTNVTLSIKNLWGCYPDPMRCLHHKYLSRKLTLITKLLKPKLIIMDGIYALDGHGPMYGTPKKMNLILSSDNPVVADTIGASLMGMPLLKVEHILMAEREGLGITDLTRVKLNVDWRLFKSEFKVSKTFIDNISVLLFNSDQVSKLIMDSPLTPLVYTIARYLRNSSEKEVTDQLKRFR
jgi:uncharacterized protein (DUF362 family)